MIEGVPLEMTFRWSDLDARADASVLQLRPSSVRMSAPAVVRHRRVPQYVVPLVALPIIWDAAHIVGAHFGRGSVSAGPHRTLKITTSFGDS